MAIERQVSRALGDIPAIGRPRPTLPPSRAHPGTRDRGRPSAVRVAAPGRLDAGSWIQATRATTTPAARAAPAARQPGDRGALSPPGAAPPSTQRRARPGIDAPRSRGRER
jgi:hypothetical protein